MYEDEMQDAFSVNAASFVAENSKGESPFYSPSADKGIDKVYSSQIKFITNIHNPSKSLIDKFVVWVKNPDTEVKKCIDCPSTIKQPSLLQDAFFELHNSKSAHDNLLKKEFSRSSSYYALVYIVKDEHQPALQGKIKILKFGVQLHDVLKESANDPEDPNNFLDFFNGRTMKLKVIEKGGNNNFTTSSFGNKVHYIQVDGEDMTDTPKNRKKLAAWLKENSPDISEYDFKPWDEETRKFVIDAIKTIIPNQSMVDRILKKGGVVSSKGKKVDIDEEDEDVPAPKKKTKAVPKVIEIDDEDEDEEEEAPKAKKSSAPPAKKKVVVEDDDEDEDEDEDDEINLDDMDDSELDEIDAHISKINKKPSKAPAKYSSTKKAVEDDDDEEDDD